VLGGQQMIWLEIIHIAVLAITVTFAIFGWQYENATIEKVFLLQLIENFIY